MVVISTRNILPGKLGDFAYQNLYFINEKPKKCTITHKYYARCYHSEIGRV